MNYKKYIIMGSAVMAAILAVIAVSLLLGREKPSPRITDRDTLVINFLDLKLTNEDLYKQLRTNYGLYPLLDEFDRHLLAKYDSEEYIDYDEIEEEIAEEKEEDDFYETYASVGIFKEEGESDEQFEARILEYKKLQYMKEAYARENHGVTETDVDKKVEEYREDVCVIPLTFTSKENADVFYAKLKDLSTDDIVQEFKNEWNAQNEDEDEEEEDDVDYIDEDFECDTVRLVYSDLAAGTYRTLVFDDLEIGKYNTTPKVISGEHTVVYKVGQANVKGNPTKLAELRTILRDELIDKKITSTFITTKVNELREAKGLVIYDPVLADQYKEAVNEDYKVYKKLKGDKNLVGKVEGKELNADQLFQILKDRYAVHTVLDQVNLAALSTIKDIQLTKTEKKDIEKQIDDLKQQYLSSGYGQYIEWKDFISAFYNASSDAELARVFALNNYLKERYILGYKDFAGANPITKEQVFEEYADWLNVDNKYDKAYQSITASHIIFILDFDKDGEVSDEERERAEKLSDQIYHGVNDENRLPASEEKGWQNIVFDYDEDEDTEPTEFQGLYSLDTTEYDFDDVFEALAKTYSEDGSAAKGGSLGQFGPSIFSKDSYGNETPVRMVEKFEQVALATAVDDYSEPFETEFGFHIVYVTKKTEAPKQPETYFDLSDEEIEDIIEEGVKDFKAYHEFYTKLENVVKQERLGDESMNYEFAKLRDEKNFSFLDAKIQKHYRALQEIYLTVDEDAE